MNKELLDVIEKFRDVKNVIIWGKGFQGKSFFEKINMADVNSFFVDSDPMVQDCLSVQELWKKIHFPYKETIIVVCVPHESEWQVRKSLLLHGLRENNDFFMVDIFVQFFYYLFMYYNSNKVCIGQLTQMSSFACTLRCKKCMASIPYLKGDKYRKLEDVIEDIDLLFEKVDYIEVYGPNGGGEPFLYSDFLKVLEYAMENYEEKFGYILIVSNGTVIPSPDILKFLGENNKKIKLAISQYDSVGGWNEKFLQFKTICAENNVNLFEYDYDYWIDMGWTAEEICSPKDQFQNCTMPCREFEDGKLFFCLHGHLAEKAYFTETRDDSLDFNSCTKEDIVLYNLGLMKKGFLNICSHCNGYFNTNKNFIAVAEQIEESK